MAAGASRRIGTGRSLERLYSRRGLLLASPNDDPAAFHRARAGEHAGSVEAAQGRDFHRQEGYRTPSGTYCPRKLGATHQLRSMRYAAGTVNPLCFGSPDLAKPRASRDSDASPPRTPAEGVGRHLVPRGAVASLEPEIGSGN